MNLINILPKNIHPYWLICLIVRLSLILLIKLSYKKYSKYNKHIKNTFIIILLIIGLGFIYKGYTGSNNEIQIAKVFWHDTRYIHGVLYILSSIYLYYNNLNISIILLFIDIVFSIIYRIITKK
jgi:L-asparagine transporter-like permease